jgi:FkbM family methyltransferase
MFKVKAQYDNGIEIKAHSDPEPYMDFPIIEGGYQRYHKLNPDDLVIDGGAYIGMFTIYAMKAVGTKGRVLAFEPDMHNYISCKNNLYLNGLSDKDLFKEGLWEEKDTLKFDASHDAEATFCCFKNNSKVNLQDIPVIDLDTKLTDLQIPLDTVDFIKLDVEGAEVPVLKGAKSILLESDVKLAVATYHVVYNRPTYIDVEKYLKKLGFKVKTGCKEHLTTYAWKE